MTATFEWQGVTVTVKRPTVRDGLLVQAVKTRLGNASPEDAADDTFDLVLRHVFARFVVLTRVDGPSNLPLPSPSAPTEDLRAALAAWSELDETFIDQWYLAMERASAPMNDPELVPEPAAPNP